MAWSLSAVCASQRVLCLHALPLAALCTRSLVLDRLAQCYAAAAVTDPGSGAHGQIVYAARKYAVGVAQAYVQQASWDRAPFARRQRGYDAGVHMALKLFAGPLVGSDALAPAEGYPDALQNNPDLWRELAEQLVTHLCAEVLPDFSRQLVAMLHVHRSMYALHCAFPAALTVTPQGAFEKVGVPHTALPCSLLYSSRLLGQMDEPLAAVVACRQPPVSAAPLAAAPVVLQQALNAA